MAWINFAFWLGLALALNLNGGSELNSIHEKAACTGMGPRFGRNELFRLQSSICQSQSLGDKEMPPFPSNFYPTQPSNIYLILAEVNSWACIGNCNILTEINNVFEFCDVG